MRSFKTHFSVVFSIFVLLFSLQCILTINKVLKSYEVNLANDYSIVVIATKALNFKELHKKFSSIKSVEELDSNTVVKKLEKDMSEQSIVLLKASMPKFYNIKLVKFPSISESTALKEALLKQENISKVEIFSKTFDRIYKVLKLLGTIVLMFTLMIFVMSTLLILKQMRIWMYEHQDRINVMTLFGAPFWTKSKALYKMALADSLIATLAVTFIFLIFSRVSFFKDVLSDISVNMPRFEFVYDGLILLFISLIFAIISTTIVVSKVKGR